MATGAEHWRQAEQMLSEAENADSGAPREAIDLMLRFAEMHVQLAQAAATIDAAYGQLSLSAAEAWLPATSHARAEP